MKLMSDMTSLLWERIFGSGEQEEKPCFFLGINRVREIHRNMSAQGLCLPDGHFSRFLSSFLEIDLMGSFLANQMN